MSDLAMFDDSPIFWELIAKYGKRFDESPWSPEFLEIEPEPTEDEVKARHWPATFQGALLYTRRLVQAQQATQTLPILALDQYAQQVDLADTNVMQVIQGVLVDD